jgi:hypothetical protein
MRWFIVLAAVSLTFLGTIPAFAEEKADAVTIEKDRILIPGAKISEKDQRELNAILAKYDKSFYKLKGYADGKATKPQGTLKDSAIDKATATRAAAHAKDPHFTGWTLQVGFTTNQDISGRTTNQDMGSNPDLVTIQNTGTSGNNIENVKKRRELVKRLEPILRKYSNKK